jgi:hypothetical protein
MVHYLSPDTLGDSLLYINIKEGPCLPVGNACQNVPPDDFITNKKLDNNYCTASNTLTINWNGEIFSCCSQCGFTKPFKLGSIYNMSLLDAIDKYSNNKFIYVLQNYGIDWFLKIINAYKLPIHLKKSYVNICDLCYTLFKNENNIELFAPYLDIIKIHK